MDELQQVFNAMNDEKEKAGELVEKLTSLVKALQDTFGKDEFDVFPLSKDYKFAARFAALTITLEHDYSFSLSGSQSVINYFLKNDSSVIPCLVNSPQHYFSQDIVVQTGHFVSGFINVLNDCSSHLINQQNEIMIPLNKMDGFYKKAICIAVDEHKEKLEQEKLKQSKLKKTGGQGGGGVVM